jgi:hypothetical protein
MTALGLRTSSRLRLSPGRRRASGAHFLPTRLPGLAFWYDAALSAYASGTWHDLSGNGNHAAQAIASQQPSQTADAAGRQLLRFDGVNDALLVSVPPDLSAGLTLFVVYRVRTPVDFRGIFTASAATGTDHQQFFTLQYEQVANRRVQVFGRSAQPNQIVVRGVDSTETQYAMITFDDDGVDVELRDLNGIAGDGSTFAPFATPATMVLGARYNNGAVFSFGAVDLYEIGLYPRELSPAERDQLEAYVQMRHGLVWNPRFIGKDLAWLHDVDLSAFALSGSQVDQWSDLSGNGRHWTQTSTDRPIKSTDGDGRDIVRFDGVDDLLALAGAPPALEPFSVGVVYRMRDRDDFTGIISAAPAAGTDHTDFWTFRNASAASLALELFGRSAELDPLSLTAGDSGAAQVAVWTFQSGTGAFRDALGSTTDAYDGSFGTPAEIVLGGRYSGAPFGYAAIDVLATVGASRALSPTDQQRLIDWASARWSL